MARYFFRADYRGITVNDDVGEEFTTLRDAEVHAAIVANELVRNYPQAVTVSVLSEDGILLAKAAAPSDRFFSRRVRRVESGLSPTVSPTASCSYSIPTRSEECARKT
jgi:Domain of unknown function (DUF6894)